MLPGVIIGAFVSHMVTCFRLWLKNRNFESNEKSVKTCDEDSLRVYQDLELNDTNLSINHSPPTVKFDIDDEAQDENDDASAYTELYDTIDVANTYQSLVWK